MLRQAQHERVVRARDGRNFLRAVYSAHARNFRREFGERTLRHWPQRRKEMRLNLLITLLALTLATVAGQSPLF